MKLWALFVLLSSGAFLAAQTPDRTSANPLHALSGFTPDELAQLKAAAPLLADNGYCVFTFNYGGTGDVTATGDIGFFAILAEGGVAAGVRRIEAVTGAGAVQWAQHQRAALARLVEALHVNEDQAVETVGKLHAEAKRLAREVTQLKMKLALGSPQSNADDTVEVGGVRLARRKVEGLDKDALRQLADSLKVKVRSGVVVLASANDGRVQIVVAVTPDLTQRVKAGQIVKEIAPIVEGGGGGRPDFAEAGGKRPDKIDEMLETSKAVLARLLDQR